MYRGLVINILEVLSPGEAAWGGGKGEHVYGCHEDKNVLSCAINTTQFQGLLYVKSESNVAIISTLPVVNYYPWKNQITSDGVPYNLTILARCFQVVSHKTNLSPPTST